MIKFDSYENFGLESSYVYALAAVAAVLACCTDWTVTKLYGKYHPLPASKGGFGKDTAGLKGTFLFGAMHSLQTSARVFLALFVVQILVTKFPVLDPFQTTSGADSSSPVLVEIHKAAPAIWMGLTFCTVKRIVFLQMVSGRKLGRMVLVDRLVDFVVLLIMIYSILDILNLDVSKGIQTVLSAGGIGALMFSLASKDLAENIIGGVTLNAWDAVDVGEKVRIGDGTEGIVLEIGLLETIIQGFDDIVTRIPNAQLTRARISNLSRIQKSRLKQELRFRYSDIDKLPDVLNEIKQEVRLSCPALIDECIAVLTEYQPDHIQGMVVAHFTVPPLTREFVLNRQDFVLAIARAMKKQNCKFCLPSMVYLGEKPVVNESG